LLSALTDKSTDALARSAGDADRRGFNQTTTRLL
jgi:hypothetical protein